jgi:hypothetical protein
MISTKEISVWIEEPFKTSLMIGLGLVTAGIVAVIVYFIGQALFWLLIKSF